MIGLRDCSKSRLCAVAVALAVFEGCVHTPESVSRLNQDLPAVGALWSVAKVSDNSGPAELNSSDIAHLQHAAETATALQNAAAVQNAAALQCVPGMRRGASSANEEAIRAYLERLPDLDQGIVRGRQLAWTLATHNDPQVRDSELAVSIARRVLEAVPDSAESHEVLGAALAAHGQFAEARLAVQRGLQCVLPAEQQLRDRLRQQADLYERGMPVIEPGTRIAEPPRDRGQRMAVAHVFVGLSFDQAGESDWATLAWLQALEFDPHCAGAMRQLVLARLRAGDIANAEKYCVMILTDLPDDPQTLAQLAMIRLHQGAGGEARVLYERAMRQRGDWTALANDLAWLLATNADATVRDPQRALLIAETLCKSAAPSARHLDTLGAALAANQRFDEAVEAVSKATACSDSAAVEGLECRRKLYEARRPVWEESLAKIEEGKKAALCGNLAEAESLLQEGLKSGVPHAEALAWLGMIAQQQGRPREAIYYFTSALVERPKWWQVANDLAWMMATHDDPAIRDPKTAVEMSEFLCRNIDSPRANCLDTLAAAYAAMGKFDEALDVVNRAMGLVRNGDGDAARLLRRRRLYAAKIAVFGEPRESLAIAKLDMREGRLDLAAAELEHSLESSGNSQPEVLATLGQVRLHEGKPASTVELYERALAARPHWPELANDLAWLLATCSDAAVRNPERAIELAEELCRGTDFQEPRQLDTLAAAYAAAGQFERAGQVLGEALQFLSSSGAWESTDGRTSAGLEETRERYRQRLERYRSRQPYVED